MFSDFFRYLFLRNSWFKLVIIIVYSMVMIAYIFFFLDISVKKDSKFETKKQEFYTLTTKLLSDMDLNSMNIDILKQTFNSVNREANGVLQEYGLINLVMAQIE